MLIHERIPKYVHDKPAKEMTEQDWLEVGMNVGAFTRFIWFQSIVMQYCNRNGIDYKTFVRLCSIPHSEDNAPITPPQLITSWDNWYGMMLILNDQANG